MANTIYDIARIAGVSIATVSRAFNLPETVSEATRNRILQIAEQVGYQPQANARTLARRKKNSIAVLVPILSNYFFMEVLAGIQEMATRNDIELHIVNLKSNEDLVEQLKFQIRRQFADGYIFISVHLTEKEWEAFKMAEQPIVLLDDYYPQYDTVSVDNKEGAYKATKAFLQSGMHRIAMISGSPTSKPILERIEGYRKALSEAGCFDPSLIYHGKDPHRDGFTERSGYEAMTEVLATDPLPEAVFCSSDVKGIGAMKAMRERGVELPMICYDNLGITEYLGLSTIAQPMAEMGRLATQNLLDRIQNPSRPVSHTVYSPELILRDSTRTLNDSLHVSTAAQRKDHDHKTGAEASPLSGGQPLHDAGPVSTPRQSSEAAGSTRRYSDSTPHQPLEEPVIAGGIDANEAEPENISDLRSHSTASRHSNDASDRQPVTRHPRTSQR